MTDLAIIGGGPAGTAAALEARRRGLSVRVWERESFPRDKVCGEFISAESIPLLATEIPELLERASVIRRAEFISRTGRVRGFQLPAPAHGLSRRVMDEGLWRAAGRAGAVTREGETVGQVFRLPRGDGWSIQTRAGAAETTRSLLVACGRWWRIEGLDSPAQEARRERAGDWLGVKTHFKGLALRHAVEMFYFPGGYCGVAPVENGIYNACCLVHRSLVRKAAAGAVEEFAAWIGEVARHPALNCRLRGAVQEGETVTTAPVRPARRGAASAGVLLAGDASGFLDPFTGDGISMALHSGRMAAEELAAGLSDSAPDFQKVARRYARRLDNSVRRSYAIAGMLRALVRAPAGIQDVAAVAMVRLGTHLLASTRWRNSMRAGLFAPEKSSSVVVNEKI